MHAKSKRVVVDKEMILPNGKLLMCDYKWNMEKQISKAKSRNNYLHDWNSHIFHITITKS